MAKPIRTTKFPGMDNVQRQGFRQGEGTEEATTPLPVVLNMQVTTDQKLVKRMGFSLWQAMPGVHSLFWTGNEFLCAAAGSASLESLWLVKRDKTMTELSPISGVGDPLFYIPVNGLVYISSRNWNGVYEDGAVRSWGESFGDDIAEQDASANSEEMMLLNTIPAPPMENLLLAGGRIFGNFGARLWYNDPPMAYEMFRPDAFRDFPEPLTMIAKSVDGMYFASAERTWFAQGFDPAGWKLDTVGDGAVPGSLQVIPQLGNANSVPVWVNHNGVQAGVGGGVQQVTQDKVRFDATGRAASLYRDQAGGQYLTNFPQPSDVGFGDSATCEVVRNGKLIQ